MSHTDLNSALILALGLLILYFVGNFRAKVLALFKKSQTSAQHFLNTQAKIKAMEFAPSGIVTIDSNGLVISWNPAATSIFGYTEVEMVGKDLMRIIPERNRELHKIGLNNVRGGGKNTMVGKTMDLTGVTKSGKEVPVRLTLWKWQDGINVFYTGIIRDITIEKEAEHKAEQLLDMYRNAEEIDDSGVWSWDVSTNIVYTSRGFDNIYEVDNEDFRESSFYLKRVYYEDRPTVEERLKQVFQDKKEYTVEYRIVGSDGLPFKIRVHGEPRLDTKGDLTNIIGTIRKL